MYVRLAFAVAAHLEPDILVVGEVLAVGDAEFQKKAIGKMKDVSRGGGRTVLFVSHNMASIRNLCPNSLLLNNGKILIQDKTNIVLSKYTEISRNTPINENSGINNENNRRGEGFIRFTNVLLKDTGGKQKFSFKMGETIIFKLAYKVYKKLNGLKVAIALRSGSSKNVVTSIEHILSENEIPAGTEGVVEIELKDVYIRQGEYPLYFHISDKESRELTMDVIDDVTAPLMIYTGEKLFNNYDPLTVGGYFSIPSKIIQNKIINRR